MPPFRINGPSQESNLASIYLIHTAFLLQATVQPAVRLPSCLRFPNLALETISAWLKLFTGQFGNRIQLVKNAPRMATESKIKEKTNPKNLHISKLTPKNLAKLCSHIQIAVASKKEQY